MSQQSARHGQPAQPQTFTTPDGTFRLDRVSSRYVGTYEQVTAAAAVDTALFWGITDESSVVNASLQVALRRIGLTEDENAQPELQQRRDPRRDPRDDVREHQPRGDAMSAYQAPVVTYEVYNWENIGSDRLVPNGTTVDPNYVFDVAASRSMKPIRLISRRRQPRQGDLRLVPIRFMADPTQWEDVPTSN